MKISYPIPIIDAFAGPGGLGEGFSRLRTAKGKPAFKIGLSIEMDEAAHATLKLRSFYRQFADAGVEVPEEYFEYLRGEPLEKPLFEAFPDQGAAASREAWNATLGKESPKAVDERIRRALDRYRSETWCLIGGPPCQAYSLVGRARRKHDPDFATDEKHFLYEEYLRILAVHQPTVFVMENVVGLLSARVGDVNMFERIHDDFKDPVVALGRKAPAEAKRHQHVGYSIYSVTEPVGGGQLFKELDPRDFVVHCEAYGIPQRRHRVILIGVRSDFTGRPETLTRQPKQVPLRDVIDDLPSLRSGLSKCEDSLQRWMGWLRSSAAEGCLTSPEIDSSVRAEIAAAVRRFQEDLSMGDDQFQPWHRKPKYKPEWFQSDRLGGVCNHAARRHIRQDLCRYLFAACFAAVKGRTPKLVDFPGVLLPKHNNVLESTGRYIFADRFRVQMETEPATTITSHICKDGHYYIHYDPAQCRSLTVREAARVQTFPDDYLFEGVRTEQYHQAGNAVPVLLAYQIAEQVHNLIARLEPK